MLSHGSGQIVRCSAPLEFHDFRSYEHHNSVLNNCPVHGCCQLAFAPEHQGVTLHNDQIIAQHVGDPPIAFGDSLLGASRIGGCCDEQSRQQSDFYHRGFIRLGSSYRETVRVHLRYHRRPVGYDASSCSAADEDDRADRQRSVVLIFAASILIVFVSSRVL